VSKELRIHIVCGVCIAYVWVCLVWAVSPLYVGAEMQLSSHIRKGAWTELKAHFTSDMMILILTEYSDPGFTPLLPILDVPGSHLFSVTGSPKRFVMVFVCPRR
jgi:hypothetical protein